MTETDFDSQICSTSGACRYIAKCDGAVLMVINTKNDFPLVKNTPVLTASLGFIQDLWENRNN